MKPESRRACRLNKKHGKLFDFYLEQGNNRDALTWAPGKHPYGKMAHKLINDELSQNTGGI
jgi:hypothetical protein